MCIDENTHITHARTRRKANMCSTVDQISRNRSCQSIQKIDKNVFPAVVVAWNYEKTMMSNMPIVGKMHLR